ncbi:MAG: acetyltransferase [Rhodocyclaceae bacterium]|nr:acetyltransferase [Rhodocyclaceae bacterium]
MKSLLLIGGGGHCRAAIDVIETASGYAVKGIVQPHEEGCTPVLGYPVLGADADLPALLAQTPTALVTVGQIKSPALRQRLFENLRALGAELPVVASGRAHVSRHAALGAGTLVMHGAVVNAGARIGVNGIVNNLALVEHDAEVGDHCHISTGARVNGGARVGDGCFVGSGAIVIQGVTIGRGCVVGAGSVVTRNLPENSIVKASR